MYYRTFPASLMISDEKEKFPASLRISDEEKKIPASLMISDEEKKIPASLMISDEEKKTSSLTDDFRGKGKKQQRKPDTNLQGASHHHSLHHGVKHSYEALDYFFNVREAISFLTRHCMI